MWDILLRDALEKQEKDDDYTRVFEVMDQLFHLGWVGRKEGLLALEMEVQTMFHAENSVDSESMPAYYRLRGADRLIVSLIMDIVDGTEPEMMMRIGGSRYFSAGLERVEALAGCMAVEGCLAIQEGISPYVLEELLMAMLPQEAEDQYLERRKKAEKEKKETPVIAIPEEFYHFEASAAEESAVIQTLQAEFINMDNQSIQRILREVDNAELAMVLTNLNGEARLVLMKNMSRRLVEMIYEDVKCLGTVRIGDAERVGFKMLKIIQRLRENGEIMPIGTEDGDRQILNVIALYEHEQLQKNRDIDFKIRQKQEEISRLENEKTMM